MSQHLAHIRDACRDFYQPKPAQSSTVWIEDDLMSSMVERHRLLESLTRMMAYSSGPMKMETMRPDYDGFRMIPTIETKEPLYIYVDETTHIKRGAGKNPMAETSIRKYKK